MLKEKKKKVYPSSVNDGIRKETVVNAFGSIGKDNGVKKREVNGLHDVKENRVDKLDHEVFLHAGGALLKALAMDMEEAREGVCEVENERGERGESVGITTCAGDNHEGLIEMEKEEQENDEKEGGGLIQEGREKQGAYSEGHLGENSFCCLGAESGLDLLASASMRGGVIQGRESSSSGNEGNRNNCVGGESRKDSLKGQDEGKEGEQSVKSKKKKAYSRTVDDKKGTCGETIVFDEDVGLISPLERRVLDWHLANLEYGCAAPLGKVSLPHWNQDDVYGGFGGQHCMIKGGYGQVLEAMKEGLDIRFEQVVSKVDYMFNAGMKSKVDKAREEEGKRTEIGEDAKDKGKGRDGKFRGSELGQVEVNDSLKVMVKTKGGETFIADAVLVTVPLGCLKAGNIEFSPPLPEWKTGSIKNLGFGVLNKVVLEFPDVFWDPEMDYFGAAGESPETRGKCFMFWNLQRTCGAPVLTGLVVGKAAEMGEEEEDDLLVEQALTILRKIFGDKAVKKPLAAVVTHWGKDPFSRGSYSYVAVGASGEDYDRLAKPVDNRLFFAGEATCREHPDTVGGAIITGLREAVRIVDVLERGIDLTAEGEAMAAAQKQSDSERAEVREIARKLASFEDGDNGYDKNGSGIEGKVGFLGVTNEATGRQDIVRDLFGTAKTIAGRSLLAKEILTLSPEIARGFAGTKEGLSILNLWMLESTGKEGLQLLRHCVRVLLVVATDLSAVRQSGIGKTVKEKVCLLGHRDVRAVADQLVRSWVALFKSKHSQQTKLLKSKHSQQTKERVTVRESLTGKSRGTEGALPNNGGWKKNAKKVDCGSSRGKDVKGGSVLHRSNSNVVNKAGSAEKASDTVALDEASGRRAGSRKDDHGAKTEEVKQGLEQNGEIEMDREKARIPTEAELEAIAAAEAAEAAAAEALAAAEAHRVPFPEPPRILSFRAFAKKGKNHNRIRHFSPEAEKYQVKHKDETAMSRLTLQDESKSSRKDRAVSFVLTEEDNKGQRGREGERDLSLPTNLKVQESESKKHLRLATWRQMKNSLLQTDGDLKEGCSERVENPEHEETNGNGVYCLSNNTGTNEGSDKKEKEKITMERGRGRGRPEPEAEGSGTGGGVCQTRKRGHDTEASSAIRKRERFSGEEENETDTCGRKGDMQGSEVNNGGASGSEGQHRNRSVGSVVHKTFTNWLLPPGSDVGKPLCKEETEMQEHRSFSKAFGVTGESEGNLELPKVETILGTGEREKGSPTNEIAWENRVTGNEERWVSGKERKNAVGDYVVQLLNPLYKTKRLSKEDFKAIVKKAVQKVMERETAKDDESSIEEFLSIKRKLKIRALIDKYVEKCCKPAR